MSEMDVNEVIAHLPQRFPFLLIDRVKELEPGKRIVALKNVSVNEPYFTGHFPHRLPGDSPRKRHPARPARRVGPSRQR